jgi:hypothetical protein
MLEAALWLADSTHHQNQIFADAKSASRQPLAGSSPQLSERRSLPKGIRPACRYHCDTCSIDFCGAAAYHRATKARNIQRQSVTPEQFKEIQADLGWTHAQTADALGLSEVSVKRIATGAQVITDQTAKMLVGLLLVHKEGLARKYWRLLDKYHGDTKMKTP